MSFENYIILNSGYKKKNSEDFYLPDREENIPQLCSPTMKGTNFP